MSHKSLVFSPNNANTQLEKNHENQVSMRIIEKYINKKRHATDKSCRDLHQQLHLLPQATTNGASSRSPEAQKPLCDPEEDESDAE